MAYNVISPDGFSIERDRTYSTEKRAKDAFDRWKRRFETQGYYSSNKGRIPIEELENYCTIIKV